MGKKMTRQKKRMHGTGLYVVLILAIAASVLFFDRVVNDNIHHVKNAYLDYTIAGIANFTTLIVILLVMTSLFLFKERKGGWIVPLWLSFLITFILGVAIKIAVGRERPIPIPAGEFFGLTSSAFPSLHTAVSFAVVPILDR